MKIEAGNGGRWGGEKEGVSGRRGRGKDKAALWGKRGNEKQRVI